MKTAELPSAVEVIADRIEHDSRPLDRNDSYRISLVLEGGGQRGAISSGAIVGLEALLGDSEPFDQTDSTSAGSFCASALMSRKAVMCPSVYFEELRENFIRVRQLGRGRVVDLSLLVGVVSEGDKKFDFDRILHSPVETHIYATSVNDAKKVKFIAGEKALESETEETENGYIVPCKNKDELILALNASAHVTWFAGEPVVFKNMLLMDGGITAGRLPIQEAIADGCTHILVVSTDKEVNPELYKRNLVEMLALRAIRKRYPVLAQRYWNGVDRHIEALELMQAAAYSLTKKPRIDVIKVNKAFIPKAMETDPHKLYIAAKAGEEAVLQTFQPYGLKKKLDSTVLLPRY
jgi:predicted patatin/cPLA2 family phospholipase